MVAERTELRAVFAMITALTVMVSVYVWTNRSTSTDWAWFYRVALPAAAASTAWGVVRPRIVGISKLLTSLSIIATVRVADFLQDWFLTPSDPERVDLVDRALLGSFGWAMIVSLTLVIHMLERLVTARWSEPDPGVGACWNAPGCPRHVDAEHQNPRIRHTV